MDRTVKVYGASDKREILEPKLVWATPGGRGFSKPGPNGVRPVPGAPAQRAAPIQAPVPAPSASQRAAPTPSQQQRAQRMSAAQQEALRKQQEARQEAMRKQQEAQQEAIRKQQEAFQRAEELRQILNNLDKVDNEGRRASLLDTLCSVDDVLALPLHPSPPGLASGQLKVDLLKHQVSQRDIFIFWMLAHVRCRAKHFSGVSNTNILKFLRTRRINRSSFGS